MSDYYATSTAVFDLLPDFADSANPEPDGHPWKKACDHCAFRPENPQELTPEDKKQFSKADGKHHFYCMHRENDTRAWDSGSLFDGVFHRVCACYAAMNSGVSLATTPARRRPGTEG